MTRQAFGVERVQNDDQMAKQVDIVFKRLQMPKDEVLG